MLIGENMSENHAPVEGENTTVESAKDEQLGEGGKRALEAEREARKNLEKELREATALIEQFKDAQRSDEEKQQHKIETLEAELNQARLDKETLEHQLLVADVAAEVGLPAELAARLQGDDRESLLADAAALKALLGPEGARKPAPVPEAGRVVGDSKRSTAEQFADAFNQAFNR